VHVETWRNQITKRTPVDPHRVGKRPKQRTPRGNTPITMNACLGGHAEYLQKETVTAMKLSWAEEQVGDGHIQRGADQRSSIRVSTMKR